MLHCYVIRLQINARNYDLHIIPMVGINLNWDIKNLVVQKAGKSKL